VGSRFATRPRGHWLAEALRRGLPVSAVSGLERVADTRPLLPSVGRRAARSAPALGEHDAAIWREFSLDDPGS
jgi:crotonobetainyl-CoA:carnitine CoA-transferase CaiB-like acyl-CoA transferase